MTERLANSFKEKLRRSIFLLAKKVLRAAIDYFRKLDKVFENHAKFQLFHLYVAYFRLWIYVHFCLIFIVKLCEPKF